MKTFENCLFKVLNFFKKKKKKKKTNANNKKSVKIFVDKILHLKPINSKKSS